MAKFSEILSEIEEYVESSIINFDCDINQFAFWPESQSWESDTLYFHGIFPKANLTRFHKRLNLIITKSVAFPPKADLAGINLIILKSGIDIQKVFDIASSLIFKNNIDEIISNILDNCKTLSSYDQILYEAYRILGNPILLMDVSMNLLDQKGCDTIKDEPYWENILVGNSPSTIYSHYFKKIELGVIPQDKTNEPIFRKIKTTEKLNNSISWMILTTSDGIEKRREIVALIETGECFFAYLKILEYNKPITKSDIQIINVFCTILSIALWSPQNSKIRQIAYSEVTAFLLSVLNRKIHDKSLINQKSHEIGLSLSKNVYVFCIRSMKEWDSNIEILFLQRKLAAVIDCKYSILMDNQIILIFDTDMGYEKIKGYAFKINSLLELHHLLCGVSTYFHDISNLPESLEQAQIALNFGINLGLNRNIFFYEDFVFYHLLSSFSNWPGISCFIHPAIKILSEMSIKGTDYLKTLQIYLECNQDLLDASKKMFMHYNTLKYRIQKIVENTGLDLHDHDVVLRLQLSFKILELEKRIS